MNPAKLLSQIYKPRILAWALAALILVSAYHAEGITDVVGAAAIWCVSYPHFVHWVLTRIPVTTFAIRLSMQLDALIVGLLIAGLGFPLETGAVLIALVLSSILIIGGPRWLLAGAITTGAGAFAGHWLLPMRSGSEPGLVTQLALVIYFLLIAYLVYQETRFLYAGQRRASVYQAHIEAARDRLLPFVSAPPGALDHALPRRRRLTVMFSDIEGFTRLMDTADESAVAAWLNRYFSVMAGIASVHGGVVDKFLGDGLMVVFGSVESRGAAADAHACLSMALEMLDRQQQADLRRCQGQRVRLRIGIHTGYCLMGCFGSEDRRDYTVLGSAVNLASRIEGCAGSNEILISEETRALLDHWVSTSAMGEICLKGIARPVSLYRVDGLAPMGTSPSQSVRLLT
jgi:class 3 adenylate cyclase